MTPIRPKLSITTHRKLKKIKVYQKVPRKRRHINHIVLEAHFKIEWQAMYINDELHNESRLKLEPLEASPRQFWTPQQTTGQWHQIRLTDAKKFVKRATSIDVNLKTTTAGGKHI